MNDAAGLRVVQLLVGESWGGAERFFVKLAGALHARGLEQLAVIKRDARRAEDLRRSGCPFVEVDFGRGLGDIAARWRLARIVRDWRPNVVVAWMNRAARRMPRGDFVKIGRLGGYYPLRHYRRCDHLIANTPDIARWVVAEGWPAERVSMLTNFGELDPAPPADRAALDTPADAVVALAMGRLHESKGFDTLLSALSLTPSLHLWLAGDGALDAPLRAQAQALGLMDRVRFLGWRDDQAALIEAADFVVVPSRHEPLSNVTLEAWSLGKPVIATASEGPSWLIEDGSTGLLTPVDDDAALAAGLRRMADDPALRARLGAAGHAVWAERFSADAVCAAYLATLRRLVEARGARP